MYRQSLFASIAITMLASVSQANTEVVNEKEIKKLDEIVVTSKSNKSIEDISSSVTVITAQDIEKMNATSVKDILRKQAGIVTVENGMNGRQNISVRGSRPTDVLFLVDGQRTNRTDDYIERMSDFQYSTVPVSMIERIEIIKGAKSSIYGSDAMGGVINIITKKDYKKPFYGEIDVQAGVSNAKHGGDEQKYSLNVGGNISDKLSINVSADNQHRDATGGEGYSAFGIPSNNATYIEGLTNTNGSVKLRYNIDDTQYISGTYAKGQEKRKDYEKSTYTDHDLYKLDRDMYSLSYEKNFDHVSVNFDYEVAKTDIHTNMCLYPFGPTTPAQAFEQQALPAILARFGLTSRPTVGPFVGIINAAEAGFIASMPKNCGNYVSTLADYKQKIKNELAKIEIKTDILKYNYIVLGATTNKESFEKYDYKTKTTTDDYDRRANSYYIQDEIELKDFIFTFGGVLDDNEKYGTKWSSNAGVVYKIDDKQRLKLSYGEGFKAPDVRKSSAGYYSSATSTYGNDDLQPETSKTYELAYEFYGDDTIFKTAIFKNDIDNMIANAEHPTISSGGRGAVYQYQNIAEATIKGFEIEGSYDFTENHSLNANYTYLKTEDKTTNKELTFRPKNTFNAGLSSRFAYDISSYLSASYVGKQYTDEANKEQIKGYTLVNAQIFKKLTKDLTARVGVDNIFDKKLDDENDIYHLKRRFVYAGLNYKF